VNLWRSKGLCHTKFRSVQFKINSYSAEAVKVSNAIILGVIHDTAKSCFSALQDVLVEVKEILHTARECR